MSDNQALDALRRLTGHPAADFRHGQLEAIEAVTSGPRRVLVVQRTGWGKSAVYFVATKMLRDGGAGPTVIVSPLLALMRNQIQAADRLGLDVRTVNSTNTDAWEDVFAAIDRDEIDCLLISPERLDNPQFRTDVLPGLLNRMGLLVVDEAHCISDWGHDFRPTYRRLEQVARDLPPATPIIATTATANDRVIDDIKTQLGDALTVIRGPLDREGLSLQVLHIPSKAGRMGWLADRIPELDGSGIVYCLTVADAHRTAGFLQAQGISARAYTGPMDNDERLAVESQLTEGALKVVVATSALAMGYDNPFITFVIHFQVPGSAVAYYQQVGRAGRAVDSSYGIALAGAEDVRIQDFFIETAFPDERTTTEILRVLAETGGLRRSDILSLVNIKNSRLDATLRILEVEGAVYRDGPRWHRSPQPWTYPAERYSEVTRLRRDEQEAMASYVQSDRCLMQQLRELLD
ncbi:MAG: ATP-dependent DNA helicase RecQ, partial [Acidimicrobiia bacterium]|nr:ATP-dependent DNA helicase RecQ [Acidimicrobiia bacterium]